MSFSLTPDINLMFIKFLLAVQKILINYVSAMVYLTGFLAGACVFHLFGPTLVAWVP